MKTIDYYYVPSEYKDIEIKEKKILNIDLSQYEEILVGDSIKQLRHIETLPLAKRISHDFFTDNDALVTAMLWTIKLEDEKIRLKTEENEECEVNSPALLKYSLERMKFLGSSFGYLYCKGKKIKKCAFITEGEMVKLFVCKQDISKFEIAIQRIAEKTTYSEYELG